MRQRGAGRPARTSRVGMRLPSRGAERKGRVRYEARQKRHISGQERTTSAMKMPSQAMRLDTTAGGQRVGARSDGYMGRGGGKGCKQGWRCEGCCSVLSRGSWVAADVQLQLDHAGSHARAPPHPPVLLARVLPRYVCFCTTTGTLGCMGAMLVMGPVADSYSTRYSCSTVA
jgi:hypothetical protein